MTITVTIVPCQRFFLRRFERCGINTGGIGRAEGNLMIGGASIIEKGSSAAPENPSSRSVAENSSVGEHSSAVGIAATLPACMGAGVVTVICPSSSVRNRAS